MLSMMTARTKQLLNLVRCKCGAVWQQRKTFSVVSNTGKFGLISPAIALNGGLPTSHNNTHFSCTSISYARPQNFSWLKQHCPQFFCRARDISVIREPHEFFQIIKNMIETAEERVVISSLYLGTGTLENELVNCLRKKLEDAERVGSSLRIDFLLDCSRANRQTSEGSSVSLLFPLIQSFPSRFRLHLFHTPDLRGVRRRLLGHKYNEGIGVQHMKLYVVDDHLLISGANLSQDYFTNRQDRYMLIRNCKPLADFSSDIIQAISQCSFKVSTDGSQILHEKALHHPYLDTKPHLYKNDLHRKLMTVLKQYCEETSKSTPSESCDTVVYPLLQFGPVGLYHDSDTIQRLWRSLTADFYVRLATGYFNLPPVYSMLLVEQAKAGFSVLTTHPESNGFFGARGVPGGIAYAYTLIEASFLRHVLKHGQHHRVTLREYRRKAWTFHAKGMWIYPSSNFFSDEESLCLPVSTVIGSPNYGHRSLSRDLEAELLLETTSIQLRRELHQECEALYQHSEEATLEMLSSSERKVPLWVKLVTPLLKTFF